ncbi:MAG: type I pullulanase [Paludibacter sp.]|nr:type I pullulanase [Paludibacter sp.]
MKKTQLILLLMAGMLCACSSTPHYATYDDYPVYDGNDLELTYSPQASSFRVWAPTASEVKLLLYDNGNDGGAYQTLDMNRSEKGTWLLKIKEDLKGKFYTFQIKVNEKWLEETPGMWVKATGVNGKRAAIIDFAETNPSGWENDVRPPLKNFTDIVLYEVHVRDFSVSPNSGMKNKGKFLAFTEHGTKNSAGESTGIDHLKELGITHVHLLPVFDFASIDETKLNENKYNWGYDPENYNVPEGSYSTNPYNPVTRIKEFKEMVQSLHQAGIRVIMDVVYNHTAKGKGSHLDLLAPGYFYRHNADSTWSNASGCGNETASERAMMRKFMIESVVYWATEYHIDGFRFDLMGIHDIVTMNAIRAALDKIDPTIFMYGEGWTAAASPLAEEKRAVKKNAKQLDNIAVFSDDLRDALKGSWMHSQIPGFVSGADSLEESVKFGVVAATQHDSIDYSKLLYSKAPYVNNPIQIINYVSCHDDMCLYDKLMESKPANATDEEIVRFDKLAQTIVFTSQGVPFIYAGEELYRNKKGIHNTFQSPDSINQINWDSKTTHKDIFNYYQGLIALRKAHAAFRMPTQEMVQQHLKFINMNTPNVVAFMLTDHVNEEVWKDILVIYNGNRKPVSVQIPQGEWNLVCNDGEINLNGISVIDYSSFVVAPSSASIMYVK